MTTKQAARMTSLPETNTCFLNMCACAIHTPLLFVWGATVQRSTAMVSHPAYCPHASLLHAWAYCQRLLHLGKCPPVCVDPVVFSMLCCRKSFFFFHTGLPFLLSIFFPFHSFCHFPLVFSSLTWFHKQQSDVCGSGGIDFSIMTLSIHSFWVAYTEHNWYPDFKAGEGALSWEGRKRTTDGKERE